MIDVQDQQQQQPGQISAEKESSMITNGSRSNSIEHNPVNGEDLQKVKNFDRDLRNSLSPAKSLIATNGADSYVLSPKANSEPNGAAIAGGSSNPQNNGVVQRPESSESASHTHSGTNGTTEKPVKRDRTKPEPECIELDDDDDVVALEQPKVKRQRTSSKEPTARETSPVPEDPKTSKELTPRISAPNTRESSAQPFASEAGNRGGARQKEPELTSYSALLDRLEMYVKNAIDKKENTHRKVLDALLAAINIQVQKEPYSVRKLILEKQLVLPNTISFPPSQVVEMLIEHDPEHQLSRVITKLFGEERPKLSETERRERAQIKADFPAPNMTRFLMEIGQDLVQEATYCDIVHARNLPEVPKNMDTYKQVAAQLKPVWESLKAKNEHFRMKVFSCQVCGFRSDSRMVMNVHRQTLHFIGRKFQCTLCSEFDTNEYRITQHYIESHALKPLPAEVQSTKVQCPICEMDFHYKGQRDAHLRQCKRDVNKLRTIQYSRAPEHIGMINRWLWDRPPMEPSILAQQQELQKQQQLKQQQQLLQQQRMAAAAAAQQQQQQMLQNLAANRLAGMNAAAASLQSSNATFLAQQQLLAQQRLRTTATTQQLTAASASNNRIAASNQFNQLMRTTGGNINPQMIQAAMQAQLRQQQQQQTRQQMGTNKPAMLGGSGGGIQQRIQQQQQSHHQQQQQRGRIQPQQTAVAHSGVTSAPRIVNSGGPICEICDVDVKDRDEYLKHLQQIHKQMRGKSSADMAQGAPLACSRCRDRFWTYEGLERHLVMGHGLVTNDLLGKAQNKQDGGRCKLCGKQYAFNMLQHLVTDHQVKLCSAEIMYSCDVCAFKCSSYQKLETHLTDAHPKNPTAGR